jgi:cytochrome c oxidase assembly factor CtaG
MVQHVLLVVVAAPLLAASAPTAALLRGVPARLRPALWASLRTTGLDRGWLQAARSPIGRWLAYVATIWAWHASVLYDAAVEHDAVHALEHLMFLATAWLVWSSIVGPRRSRLPPGLGVLGTFTLALQSVFLAALLTFARTPWYQPYTATAPRWGLEPLADQQLAGVIMWIPAGLAHTAIGVVLLALWLHDIESAASAPAPPLSSQPPSGSPAPGARDAG